MMVYDGGFPGRAEGFLGCFSAHDIPTHGLMGGNKPVGRRRPACLMHGSRQCGQGGTFVEIWWAHYMLEDLKKAGLAYRPTI